MHYKQVFSQTIFFMMIAIIYRYTWSWPLMNNHVQDIDKIPT